MFTEIMLVDNSTRIECVQSLIDCMAKNEINTFMHTNMEFVHIPLLRRSSASTNISSFDMDTDIYTTVNKKRKL
jgi:hypothetical protein